MDHDPVTYRVLRATLEAIASRLEDRSKQHMDSDVINRMERAKIYRELVDIIRGAKP